MDGDIEDAGSGEGKVESIFWIRSSSSSVAPLSRRKKRNRILVGAAERVEKVHAKAQTLESCPLGASGIRRRRQEKVKILLEQPNARNYRTTTEQHAARREGKTPPCYVIKPQQNRKISKNQNIPVLCWEWQTSGVGRIKESRLINMAIKRKLFARSDRVKGIDFHPTEPWILSTLYSGKI